MSFFSGVEKLIGIENYVIEERFTILGKKGIVIEGHRGIYSFSDEKIEVKLKKCLLELIGKNFKVTEINCDELIIEGKIISVNFIENI